MRRISSWEKLDGGNVRGKALQDLGYDCFAVYVSVFVYEVAGGGWNALVERAHFPAQTFHAGTRHYAMMLAESMIARYWSEAGVLRWVAENPGAYGNGAPTPCAVPLTDCKKYPFWKPKAPIGPKPEPAYMKLLTPEIIFYAKLPSGASADTQEAWLEEVNEHLVKEGLEPLEANLEKDYGDDEPL